MKAFLHQQGAWILRRALPLLWYVFLSPALVYAQEEIKPIVLEEAVEKTPDRDATSSGDVLEISPSASAGTLEDVVVGLVGVQQLRSGGPGRRTSLSIRGTDNQQLSVFWDDVPLQSALGGGVDLSLIPAAGLEKVEVYRGGNALLGAYALGGGLRLVSGSQKKSGVSIQTRAGSFGTVEGQVQGGGGNEGLDWHTALRGGFREGNFPFIDTNGNHRIRSNNQSVDLGWSSRVRIHTGSHTSLSLSNLFVLADREMPGVEQFPTPSARLEDVREVAAFRVEHRFDGDFFGHGTLWFQDRETEYQNPDPYLSGPIANRFSSRGTGMALTLSWLGSSVWVPTGRVEGAGEWAHADLSGESQHAARSTLGGAFGSEFLLFEERFVLHPAIRVDWISDQEVVAAPKIGARYQALPWLALKTNLSRAYRPPTFEELYFEYESVRGNSSLSAEKAWSLDGSVALGSAETGVEVGGFWIWIDNLILFLPTTAFVVQADDSHGAISRGLESRAYAALNRYLRGEVGYTWTDVRFRDTGMRLPARSPHQVFGRLGWRRSWVDVQATVLWRSGFTLDRFEQLREEGRLELGAKLNLTSSDRFVVSVEARNLLDKRDSVDSLQQPLPGRSLYASTTLSF